jgi:transcriptional regulator GlxA family with amidase domain
MAPTEALADVQNRQLSPMAAQNLSQMLRHVRDLLDHDQDAAAAALDRAAQLLQAPPAAATRTGGLAQWQVLRLTRHVELHLDRPILQKELAALVRLSSGHFARCFRSSFGRTPHAYVMEQRIQRAKALMVQTTMRLCEIALCCGLADQAHLSRVFRKRVGSTPMAWRRQHQSAAGTRLDAGPRRAAAAAPAGSPKQPETRHGAQG